MVTLTTEVIPRS